MHDAERHADGDPHGGLDRRLLEGDHVGRAVHQQQVGDEQGTRSAATSAAQCHGGTSNEAKLPPDPASAVETRAEITASAHLQSVSVARRMAACAAREALRAAPCPPRDRTRALGGHTGRGRCPRVAAAVASNVGQMTTFGLQLPNFSFGVADTDLFDAVADRAVAAEEAGFPLGLGDGSFLPAAPARRSRSADARGLHAARGAGRSHRAGPARHARHRRDLPQPGAAGQDHHHARRHLQAVGPSSASAAPGTTSSTMRSDSSTRGTRCVSTGSRKRCRSAGPCSAGTT